MTSNDLFPETLPDALLLQTVCPDGVRRMNRLKFAIKLLCNKTPPGYVRLAVVRHFNCSRMTAWRVVDMAMDLTQ